MCTSLLGTLASVALGPPAPPVVADLKPHTLQAFQRYAAATEARLLEQVVPEGPFLYLDYLPQQDRDRTLSASTKESSTSVWMVANVVSTGS